MGKGERERRAARRAPFRARKPKILVVCEGEVTEREYIEGFARFHKNPLVDVEVHPGKGVPETVVRYAMGLKKKAKARARGEQDSNLRYNSVWCVFDVDDHPNLSSAKEMARMHQIETAISNPCIELWLLLHFREQPGPQQREELTRMLRKFITGYDKHVDFEDYMAGYDGARHRAMKLDELAIRDKDDGRNPTTGVWRLTDTIKPPGDSPAQQTFVNFGS